MREHLIGLGLLTASVIFCAWSIHGAATECLPLSGGHTVCIIHGTITAGPAGEEII